jgi:hypothetical protein
MKIKAFSTPLSCILKCIGFLIIVINKKIILAGAFVVFLNGCVQNTAMLGPAYTFSSSGSVFQTGLSYSSNKIYTKYKEEKNDKKLQEIMKSEKRNRELKNLLKAQITKTRKKLKITN